jgi:hypothetical protein
MKKVSRFARKRAVDREFAELLKNAKETSCQTFVEQPVHFPVTR